MSARPLRRLAIAAATGATVVLALPAAAGAHVEAEAETVAGVTTVTFGFHHGCDGAATTGLRIQLPEGATDVEPQDVDGWTSEVSGGELSWSGGSIADGAEGEFVATMVLAQPEGTTVFLPTIQQCGTAQSDWIDTSDDPEAEHAAPRIVAGAAMTTTDHGGEKEDGHGSTPDSSTPEKTTNGADPGTTATSAPDRSETAAPATEQASSTSSSNAPLIIGIIAAVVVIGGLIAFLVTRKGSSPTS